MMKVNIKKKDSKPNLPDAPIAGHVYQRIGTSCDEHLYIAVGENPYLYCLTTGNIWASGDDAWGETRTNCHWIDVTGEYEICPIFHMKL